MGDAHSHVGSMTQDYPALSETESEDDEIYSSRDSARGNAQRGAAGTPASTALIPDVQSDEEDLETASMPNRHPLTSEAPENSVETARRPSIGDTVQKLFAQQSGKWLYEGRIVGIDDSGAHPTYQVEFSNGHRQAMSTEEVSEAQIVDESSFNPRNVGVELSTDNILPEGSRRLRSDNRRAAAAKKVTYKNGILIPKTHAQAMRTPECEEWLKAEQKELDAMRTYDVFEQVDYLPEGVRPIHFMVLYTVKDDGRF
ncbi:MAG: hypothetical protein AAFY15_08825, partial [Cyanobacteria bacterium J06648_11]